MSGYNGYPIRTRRNRANVARNCSMYSDSSNHNNRMQHHDHLSFPTKSESDAEQKDDEISSLKLELPTHQENHQNSEDNEDDDILPIKTVKTIKTMKTKSTNNKQDCEEKECGSTSTSTPLTSTSNTDQLSYCNGFNKTPLSVPMVADTNQQSVTRNDAKMITESRLKRLKLLSQRPEQTLSKDQKDEKKRIIRLEKNRRAAAMSRRKKKMYVKNLEEKTQLMARHLAILEMENGHLRALLNATQHSINPMIQMNMHKMPHFTTVPNVSHSETTTNSSSMLNTTTNTSTSRNSLEPDDHSSLCEPPLKKRRISDISMLEPLALENNNNDSTNDTKNHQHDMNNNLSIPPLPSIPLKFIPTPTMLAPNIYHPPRLLPYPINGTFPSHLLPPMPPIHNPVTNNSNNNNSNDNDNDINNNNNDDDRVATIEAIVLDKEGDEDDDIQLIENREETKKKQEFECDDLPPPINIPELGNNDFVNMMGDDIIYETLDECGSVMVFSQEDEKGLFI